MSNKRREQLDASDRVLREVSTVGMDEGVKQIILRVSGFELFNTRPYHNYETWSDGYLVIGRADGTAMTKQQAGDIIARGDAPSKDYVKFSAEDMDDACRGFAGVLRAARIRAREETAEPKP